jgi:glutamate/aspartate transport system substrate-binding protein
VLTTLGQAMAICLVLCIAVPTRAQDKIWTGSSDLTGTLQKIKDSGAIRLGYRESALPFAFLANGQPVGYSIDLCNAIVRQVSAELGGRVVGVEYRPVTTQNRFSLLVSGGIDLECGSSTNNLERQEQVAFSPVIFVTGTKLLVKRDSPVTNLRDLRSKTVVVTRDTTNAAAVEALSEKQRLGIKFLFGRDHNESFEILASGKADAFANDDVLLHGLIADAKMSRDYRIVGDSLSYEPYGLAFRRDDFPFADAVERTFQRIAKTGEIDRLYEKWFLGPLPSGVSLNLPMSSELEESIRSMALMEE